MAAAAAVGCRYPSAAPRWIGVAAIVVALYRHRPLLLCLAVATTASSLSQDAWRGLRAPERYENYRGTATLVADPEKVGFVVRAGVRIDGHRYEATASGSAGASLFRRLAGEQVELVGRFTPLGGSNEGWVASKHYRARLQVEQVGSWSSGDPLSRAANRLRRALAQGAASLPADHRALLSGFVLGDDRTEPPVLIDEFRASGLSHLTAVSGENVAFVLAVAAPVLTRLRLRPRLVATIAVVAFFAFLTRFEPSVMRACAMAGLAAWRTYLARPASAPRLLALAVTGLLLVDPLLVHSVGFGLSVGASAGIIGLSHRIASRLRALPGPLAEPLAVTLAAQVGVLPLSLGLFGTVPVVSIPANLLAVPAAGPVMMWGLTGGLAAGTFARPIASLLHLPTRLAIGWIALVARIAARLPLGEMGAAHVVVLAAAGALGWLAARHGRAFVRSCAIAVTGGVFVAAALAGRPAPVTAADVGSGARLWVGGRGETVLAAARADPGALAVALRQRGVHSIDVLVLESPRPLEALTALTERVRVRHVVALQPGDAVVVRAGDVRVDVQGTATPVR